MKLTLNIVGDSIQDIENALYDFMDDIKNRTLESNCYVGSIGDDSNTQYDYDFSDSNDLFEDGVELTIHPYK